MRTTPLVLLAAALLLPRTAAAGDGPSPAEVQKAIGRGVESLDKAFSAGFPDDTWHGPVELVVLAMAHAGANLKDPVFAKGVETIEKSEPRFTYRTALLAMALAEVNPRRYQGKIAHCAQWLVDTQCAGGEWGYPGAPAGSYLKSDGLRVAPPARPEGETGPADAPRDKIVVERRPPEKTYAGVKGDFSNTQLAILGLRACRDAGVVVPKDTWKGALAYLRSFQRKDGGWGYVMQGEQDEASYASLTFAAVCSMAICLDALGTKDVKGDAGVKKGLKWLADNFDVSKNVGMDQSSVMGPRLWQYYHLYSLERAGRVLGLSEIGKVAWYPAGAQWILEHQQADGSWLDDPGPGPQPPYFHVADTCFALLFLTRATRPLTGP